MNPSENLNDYANLLMHLLFSWSLILFFYSQKSILQYLCKWKSLRNIVSFIVQILLPLNSKTFLHFQMGYGSKVPITWSKFIFILMMDIIPWILTHAYRHHCHAFNIAVGGVLWKSHGEYCEIILDYYHSIQILIRLTIAIFGPVYGFSSLFYPLWIWQLLVWIKLWKILFPQFIQ